MRSLSRKKDYRKSTFRNMATSLILFERITTTTAKAKELKPIVEHLINSARPGDLTGRRKLLAYLFDENAVKKTIDELIPRYANTPTGFIRTYKVGIRKGDGADQMIVELQKDNSKEETKVSTKIELKDENANSKKVATAKPSATTKKTDK
jgi:large subunit ribosomal protein L17